ncbi:MAG: ATP-binding protein [Acidobacteriota bacterium]|nr:ATP-binding protein [Acidobacteriota bacterium]
MAKVEQSKLVRDYSGQSQSGVAGYLLAVSSVLLCTLISLQIAPIAREAPFLVFIPSVLLTLWYAGFRPAMLALFLSGLSVDYFFLPPLHVLYLSEPGFIKEVVYVFALGGCSWLIDRARRKAVQGIALRDRMIESSTQPIFITSLDHRATYWNAGASKLFGWREEEVLGRNIHSLLQTEFPRPLAELDAELHQQGSWRGVLKRRSKGGEAVITESSWTYDESTGSILQTDLIITGRVRAEAQAQENAAKLKTAVQSCRDAFLICDTSGGVVEWNEAYAYFLRIPAGEASPEAIEAAWKVIDLFYVSGEPVPAPEYPRARALSGQTVSQLDYELRRRDTGESWAGSYSFSPLHDLSGAVIGAVVTARDVTLAREMERELRRLNRALGAITRVNQVLMQSHDLGEEEMMCRAVEVIAVESGYPLAWIGVPEQNQERTVKAVAIAGRASEYARRVQVTWRDEPSGRGPTGTALREGAIQVSQNYAQDPRTAVWVRLASEYDFHSVISLPLKVEGQTVAALTVYSEQVGAFDHHEVAMMEELAGDLAFGVASIRNRIAAEEERQQRIHVEKQLQQAQKLEAIGTMAGGIAHDFNNLLMVIMAQIEVLSLDLEGAQAKRAQAVQRSASRAAELTRQLLAFSRKQVTQPSVTSVNTILNGFMSMTTRLLREDIEVKVSLCDNAWPVQVDRSQFEQVVMNLVVNARDAMPEGGHLTLETSNVVVNDEYILTHPLVPAGRYSMCAVTDTGTGMTPEVQAHIFEPFYTTKGVGQGTGLGLAVVYGIIKQAGGFIWVYSEAGKGTSFKIYLPVAATAESAEPEVAAGPVHVRTQSRILMVEDDPELRNIIREFLEGAGHHVVAAENPQQALDEAAAAVPSFAVLLTDVVLKGGNGRVLAERLCSQDTGLKVVYMSGYTPNAIVHHGVLDPGVQFLQKPFSRATLLRKIDDVLDPAQTAPPMPPQMQGAVTDGAAAH